jgi:hypothetical protein
MKRLFEFGGIGASIVLIALGVGSIVVGFNGRRRPKSPTRYLAPYLSKSAAQSRRAERRAEVAALTVETVYPGNWNSTGTASSPPSGAAAKASSPPRYGSR